LHCIMDRGNIRCVSGSQTPVQSEKTFNTFRSWKKMIKLTHEGGEGMTQGRNEVEFINKMSRYSLPVLVQYYSVELDTGAVHARGQPTNHRQRPRCRRTNCRQRQRRRRTNCSNDNNAVEQIVDNVNAPSKEMVP
jgi:hypothetical protein